MELKNVIFDFNGVLFWDTTLHEHVWKTYALKLRGIPLSKHELHEHFHGRTNKSCFEYLLGREVKGTELNHFITERESLYRSYCLELGDGFKLSPGAIPFLQYLFNHNIPRTIATSSEKTNVDFFIEHLQLSKWFDLSKIVYDQGLYPGKPAPDIYMEAARKLGANPGECLVIEDAKSGIQAAHTAGIGKIIAIGPKSTHALLKTIPGVNNVIARLGELVPKPT